MIIYCRPRVTPTSSLPSQTEVSSAVCSLNNSEFSLLSDQLREQLASVWSARGSVSTSIARSVERCIRLDCPALSRNHPFFPLLSYFSLLILTPSLSHRGAVLLISSRNCGTSSPSSRGWLYSSSATHPYPSIPPPLLLRWAGSSSFVERREGMSESCKVH